MDKLPRWSGKKIINVFKKNGWTLDRIEGSHHILVREGTENILVIPVHGNNPIKVGLLKGLIKDASLTNEDFLRLCGKGRR
ncbi:MAG: type II toxin-antitoxin system HicA family toxin [ANME-2 cluster archaeon]|nr:type II toxin-antitoxin system HicA family toxin [ANME-2 cluster archaeon]